MSCQSPAEVNDHLIEQKFHSYLPCHTTNRICPDISTENTFH